MSAEELSHFLVPFAFYDSFHDKIFLSQLEQRLVDDLDLFKDHHLSRLWSAIMLANGKLAYSRVMEAMAGRLKQMAGYLNTENLLYIAGAFSIALPTHKEAFEILESELKPEVLTNFSI